MYYVYLIQSEKDLSFYIGQTDNIENRLKRHNNGLVASTKKRVPWKLTGYEKFANRNEARWQEYRLKNNYSEKKKFIAKFMPL